MLSFEEAAKRLDEFVDALPEGIYDDLNGGVNLIDAERRDEDGRYVMGLYHHDAMGRYVEIFYGSFTALYGGASDEIFAAQLRKTLHHELTHHIENKAGDRTLERWDAEQKALWEQGEPIETDSVLFVDGGGGLLALAADSLFRDMAAEKGIAEIFSGCAVLDDDTPPLPVEAFRQARAVGADLAGGSPPVVSRELLKDYGAILCMTMEQADALSERFPEFDKLILCLGERDITVAEAKNGWAKAMRTLRKEVAALVDELAWDE